MGHYRPQDRLDRSSHSFYSIAYVTQRTNEGSEVYPPLFPVFLLFMRILVLPSSSAVRFCGNIRLRLRIAHANFNTSLPISLFLSLSALFILYTITPQFAAKCPSNLLTAQCDSTSFIKWLIASIYLRVCVVFRWLLLSLMVRNL